MVEFPGWLLDEYGLPPWEAFVLPPAGRRRHLSARNAAAVPTTVTQPPLVAKEPARLVMLMEKSYDI